MATAGSGVHGEDAGPPVCDVHIDQPKALQQSSNEPLTAFRTVATVHHPVTGGSDVSMTLTAGPDPLESVRSMIRSLQRRRLVSKLDPDEQRRYRQLVDTEAAMIAGRCGS